MREELWKDIPEYEGMYQISTLGKVRSLDIEKEFNPVDRKPYKKILKGRVLKQRYDGEGYAVVTLCKNGERKIRRIYRLVAITFLENPLNHRVVEFKDGDMNNFEVNNLKWVKNSRIMMEAYERRANKSKV